MFNLSQKKLFNMYQGPGIVIDGYLNLIATSIDFRNPKEVRISEKGNSVYEVEATNPCGTYKIGDMLLRDVKKIEKSLLSRSILIPKNPDDCDLLSLLEIRVAQEFGLGTIFTSKGMGIVLPEQEKAEGLLADYYQQREEIFAERRAIEGKRNSFRERLSNLIGEKWKWPISIAESPSTNDFGKIIGELLHPDNIKVYLVKYWEYYDKEEEDFVYYKLIHVEDMEKIISQAKSEILGGAELDEYDKRVPLLYEFFPWFENVERGIFNEICRYLGSPAEDGIRYQVIIIDPEEALEFKFSFYHEPAGTGGATFASSSKNILFGIKEDGTVEWKSEGFSDEDEDPEKFIFKDEIAFVYAEASASCDKRIMDITIYLKEVNK